MSNTTTHPAANPFARIALTPAMQGILSALLRAVIDRRDELNDACEEDETFAPHICTSCRGTGYILIPHDEGDILTDISDVSDDDVPPPTLDFDHRDPVVSPLCGGTSSLAAQPVASVALVDVAAEHTPTGNSGAATVSEVASLLANLMRRRGPQSTATIDRTPQTSTQPAAPAAGATGPPAAQSSSINAATTVAAATAPDVSSSPAPPAPQLGWPGTVPLVLTPIPGFLSLGPNATPPNVDHANFAPPGSTRFYTVTRGIRVGVFGGWSNTSPYVTGVPAAAYIRHKTLHEALEAYHSAHSLGFVMYL